MDPENEIELLWFLRGGTPLNAAPASGIGLLEFYTFSN